MKRCVALLACLAITSISYGAEPAPRSKPLQDAFSPDVWRQEKRIIDLHQHIEASPERIARALKILDPSGVGVGVNLGTGTTTHKEGEPSGFEQAKKVFDEQAPGRFIHSMVLDYGGWDADDWSEKAVQQIEEGHRLGAAGLKEYKRLGLFLRDGKGQLIKVDDPKLDPVWKRCGELAMPVSIHVGDPKAFWLPYDENNERWTELKDHRNWWFGDPATYPPRMDLLDALNRVIERHPGTTFVCVHFANNPEDLEWVEKSLDQFPNMYADMAARIPEVGRHEPAKVRKLFEKHQDRILFATDFMVYGKLILGSGGDAENPSDEDGKEFFRKCWRWFETRDRNWAHMTPIQGNWLISSIDLPPEICRKIYFDNARRLFARSLPLPVVTANHIERDFVPDGVLDEEAWSKATPVRLEYQSNSSVAKPELSTPVRVLWSDEHLYLAFEAPYTQLSVFPDPKTEERIGLWDNDVVEAFIGSEPDKINRYTEYEWAPNGEFLDLKLDRPNADFPWSSGAEWKVKINETGHVWTVETRIPLKGLAETKPKPGTRWKINFYRHDRAARAGLALSPTLQGSFHTPERFGWLVFTKD